MSDNATVPEVLQKLFDEYLETLDDNFVDEYQDTDKGFASSVLVEFMVWLENQKAVKSYEKMGS